MKYTDHFALGRFVIDMYEIDNKLQRAMFIWGNVIPDFDKLSYLQSYFRLKEGLYKNNERPSLNERRRLLIAGHTAEGSVHYVNKMSRGLMDKDKWSLYDWYRFGKTAHYVADSFTHPHTLSYKEGFFAHVNYEEALHMRFTELLDRFSSKKCNLKELINKYLGGITFDSMYKAYRSEPAEVDTDCSYILAAVTKYVGYVMARA